jgi:hypothetical protein
VAGHLVLAAKRDQGRDLHLADTGHGGRAAGREGTARRQLAGIGGLAAHDRAMA